MSCTTVYAIFKTKVNVVSELKNSHGSGPAIWNYISIKLTGEKFNFFNSSNFWPLWKHKHLSKNERAVLLSTYDRSFISIDNLMIFSNACKQVSELIINNTDWDWNHFQSIGDIAEELSNNHDYRCKGICIGCTSVSDLWECEDIKNIETWEVYEEIDLFEARDKE